MSAQYRPSSHELMLEPLTVEEISFSKRKKEDETGEPVMPHREILLTLKIRRGQDNLSTTDYATSEAKILEAIAHMLQASGPLTSQRIQDLLHELELRLKANPRNKDT